MISIAAIGLLMSASMGNAQGLQIVRPTYIRSTSLDGRQIELPAPQARATLLIFILHDCPVCNRYAPEIRRITDEYRKENVRTYVVYDESDVTKAIALQHAKAYGLDCGLLFDPNHAVAHWAGAVATPEAVLLGPNGTIAYHGRIDDTFTHPGMAKPTPSARDLRAALDSFVAGKKITVADTPVVGCAIPRD
jgi:peroxiredoxin